MTELVSKSAVEEMAVGLLQSNGLIQYSFGFDRAIRRAGQCDFSNRRITLSRHFVENSTLDQIHQVLLHEIAHALSGQGVGHGKAWKEMATALGYRHEKLDGASIAKNSAKYLGVCASGHKHYRMRKPTTLLSCKLCSPSFSRKHLIGWTRNN